MAEDSKSKKPPVDKTPKVFDIAHPSKSSPSATSKPVIVGHKNIIKNDPMVSPIEVKKAEAEPETPGSEVVSEIETKPEMRDKPKHELTIAPPNQDETPEEATTQEPDTEVETADSSEDTVSPDEPVTEEAQDEENLEENDADKPEETQAEPEPVETSSTSEEATLNAVVDGVNTKKERIEEDKKLAKRNEEIQGLINSKKYNVKIHAPAKTRNIRWLLVLLVFVLLAVAAWYFTMGPGKDLWINTEPKVSKAPVVADNAETKKEEAPKEESKSQVFEDKELGLSFEYLKEWTVDVSEVEEPSSGLVPAGKYTVVTLSSPEETIKTSDLSGTFGAESKAYLRTQIYIRTDSQATEDSSGSATFTNCSTEDIVIGEKNLKLSFVDTVVKEPNVSTLFISSENCKAEAKDTFSIPALFLLKPEKNQYAVITKFVYTDDYLKGIGVTDQDVLDATKKDGVLVTKDTFKKSENYEALLGVYKSFKEL